MQLLQMWTQPLRISTRAALRVRWSIQGLPGSTSTGIDLFVSFLSRNSLCCSWLACCTCQFTFAAHKQVCAVHHCVAHQAVCLSAMPTHLAPHCFVAHSATLKGSCNTDACLTRRSGRQRQQGSVFALPEMHVSRRSAWQHRPPVCHWRHVSGGKHILALH